MSAPVLTIEDVDGNVYSFLKSFWLTTDPASARTSVKDLMYAHGGVETGDKFVGARSITIVGELFADSGAALETLLRALTQAVLKGGELRMTTDTVSRHIDVSTLSIDSEWLHWPNYKRVDVTFGAVFPFWEDDAETTLTQVVAGDDTVVVDASGSDHIVMPVIEVDADQGVDVPSVKFVNVDDGGLTFEYNNPSLVSGDVLVIDSTKGEITRNANDAIEFLIGGAFVRLQPRSNSISYEGAACTIKVKYRKVYL